MTITEDYLRLRSVECGDCWIWSQSYTSSGIPLVSKKDGGVPVRRLIARDILKKDMPPGSVAASSCHERKCVNPEHTLVLTRAKLLVRSRANTNQAIRNAKIAQAKRKRAKLTPEAVADIKSRQETSLVYAARYGVHHTMVSKIWCGGAWKEIATPQNPFAGMFTSLAANDAGKKRA